MSLIDKKPSLLPPLKSLPDTTTNGNTASFLNAKALQSNSEIKNNEIATEESRIESKQSINVDKNSIEIDLNYNNQSEKDIIDGNLDLNKMR